MKSPRSLSFCVCVLLALPSLASAAEPSLVDWVRNRVEDGLIKPLVRAQGSRFSRSRPPPSERRVRVLQTTLTLDKTGHGFVPFSVDVRFGSEWQDDIVGCVYRGSGQIFVKKGDAYRPTAFLLGKNLAAVAGVCEAAPPARS